MSYLSLKPGPFFTVISSTIIFEFVHFPFFQLFLTVLLATVSKQKPVTFTRADAEKGL